MRNLNFLSVTALLLGACQRQEEGQTANNVAGVSAEQTENSAAGGPVNSGGCTRNMVLKIDPDKFKDTGEMLPPAASDAQIEDLKQRAGSSFKRVADSLCQTGELSSEQILMFDRLHILNGSGAATATVFGDSENYGRTTLVFQYMFREDDLSVPPDNDIKEGILCYFEEARAGCDERAP